MPLSRNFFVIFPRKYKILIVYFKYTSLNYSMCTHRYIAFIDSTFV